MDPVVLIIVGILCAGLGFFISRRTRALPDLNRDRPTAGAPGAKAKLIDTAAITIAGGLLMVLGLLISSLGAYIFYVW